MIFLRHESVDGLPNSGKPGSSQRTRVMEVCRLGFQLGFPTILVRARMVDEHYGNTILGAGEAIVAGHVVRVS
jgi:hypothetical protein